MQKRAVYKLFQEKIDNCPGCLQKRKNDETNGGASPSFFNSKA
jgi:hypothetical protein